MPRADASEPAASVEIRRYPNRRLYDTRQSRYVSLDEVGATIRAGHAVRVVDRLLAQAGTDRQVLFQTACGLSILGTGWGDAAAKHLDRAFDVLTKLVDGGWQDPAGLKTDPDLDAVRKDKRFPELLRRLQTMKPEPNG